MTMFTQIRGVEVGIVVLVLIVWAGAIALFFNRWGKIRMLLPYQPDYKQEQLKVPGTGVCSGSNCNGQHSHQVSYTLKFTIHLCADLRLLSSWHPINKSVSVTQVCVLIMRQSETKANI